METADVPLRRKYAKGAESAGQQRFSPLIVSSHAGGHWFESSSLHQEKTLESQSYLRIRTTFQITVQVALKKPLTLNYSGSVAFR